MITADTIGRLGDDGILRVYPHSYNTDDDIDRLLVALRRRRDLLRLRGT